MSAHTVLMNTGAEIEQQGYSIAPALLQRRETATVSRALERRKRPGPGTRNLLELPWCHALAVRIKQRLDDVGAVPSSYVAVQCALFDKTAARNWLVALHQDLFIPVRAQRGLPPVRLS